MNCELERQFERQFTGTIDDICIMRKSYKNDRKLKNVCHIICKAILGPKLS